MVKKKKAKGPNSTDQEILAFLKENLFWVRWVPVTFVCIVICLIGLFIFKTTEKQIVNDSRPAMIELKQDNVNMQKIPHDYLVEVKPATHSPEPNKPNK